MQPIIHPFFDPVTCTVTYAVRRQGNPGCAMIDSVLDYDPKAGRTSTASADKVIAFVREHGSVEELREHVLHATDVLANRNAAAQLPLQICRSRQVVGMRMCLSMARDRLASHGCSRSVFCRQLYWDAMLKRPRVDGASGSRGLTSWAQRGIQHPENLRQFLLQSVLRFYRGSYCLYGAKTHSRSSPAN